jgi:RNA polymerase sigma-70 factor (ECF subfamily)
MIERSKMTDGLTPEGPDQWERLTADVGRLVAQRLPATTDIDDVVQEVLVRVWRHGRDLRNSESYGAWLSRIVYTASMDLLRSRQRHPLSRSDAADQAAASADEPETRTLIASVLRPFVDALPAPYAEAITLSELEGLSHPTIARRLGLSVSGVKSRVQRGREKLRDLLERCCEIALDARGAPISCAVKPDAEIPPGCCTAGCPVPPPRPE